jgi:4-amino-4-deoxy-L-arabinose transferase-like glycosyltransferase
VVSVLGLALRVGYVLAFRRGQVPMGNDSYFFSGGANLLADGQGFIQPHVFFLNNSVEQAADHPPGYLLWLAIASVMDPGQNTSQVTHMLWSCVLGAGAVVMCGLVGRRVAGPRAGLVAAVIAAVYPNLWLHDGQLMSETMSIFTVSLVLWSAYYFWEKPSVGRAAWLALCCGLAALTRPEFVLLIPVLLLPLVVMLRRASWRSKLRWLTVGGATALATLAPWIAFNFSRFEEPVYMSTNFAVTLAAANCDSTYYGDLIGYKDWNCAVAAHEAAAARIPDWDNLDASQRDQQLRPEVTRYVRGHVGRVPAVVAARLGRMLKLYGVGQEIEFDNQRHGQPLGVVYAGAASWYVVAGLAVAGAVALRRRRQLPVFPLLVVPALVLLAAALTFGQTRYRAPAEPAVVVLAAVAIDAVLPRRRAAPPDDPDAALPEPARARVSMPV